MIQVLIADDHQIVRCGLRDLLTTRLGEPVRVGEAANASETLELFHRQEWDLVMLDINMPGRNGLEVLEETRKLRPKTPVLVLTSYPEEQFALRALKLGAAGYLNKVSANDELITAVKRVLAGGKYLTSSLAERLAANLGGQTETPPHELLSLRELQVLRSVAVGKSIKEIAAELSLSEKTVATYRARISEKTSLKTSVDIARYALKYGLVD
jgi:two-component system, NarL family, invasion response regulator UvrY